MSATTLTQAPVGQFCKIYDIQSTPEICHRLRELGFYENAIIRCTINHDSHLVCEVCNTRIGLNEQIAKEILVVPFG